MMNVNTRSAQPAHTGYEGTDGDTSTASGETSPSGGLERALEIQQPYLWNGYTLDGDAELDPIDVRPVIEPSEPNITDADGTDAIHHTPVEWHTVYQELSDIRAQLDQLPGANVINQQGAVDCIAQIAGGDIVTITEYFNEHNLNITLNQWNDFSPAVTSIRTELLRAQAAQILPWEIAQQTQTELNIALEQAYNPSSNAAAIQTALDAARQSLESYATQVADNVKTEFAAANQQTRLRGYSAEHARRACGWLGIFVGVVKLILAIEFVSKLVPLLALL